MPVCKEEVEVLEGLPQEERLHHVPWPRIQRVSHLVKSQYKKEKLKITNIAQRLSCQQETNRFLTLLMVV